MDYRITLKETGSKKVYVDPQEEEGFYLYPGEVRKAGLTDGMVMSEDAFWTIHQQYAVPRAKKRALGLLMKKDMTRQELVDKLESSLHDSRSITIAVEFMTEHGYIDEENYCRDYIYFRRGKKSFRQIREELSRKGIDRELLQRVFEEEGEQDVDEIRPLVLKYAKKFSELDYKNTQKICMHFGRKGYPVERVRDILSELEQKET